MNENFLFIFGFATLLSLESAGNHSVSFTRTLGLLGQIAIITLLYVAGRRLGTAPPYGGAFNVALPFLGAWALNRMLCQPRVYFLALFSLFFFLRGKGGEFLLAAFLKEALFLVLGLALVHFLLTGIRKRLMLSRVPRPLAGLPILLLAVSLVALAFSWIR